MIGDYCERYRHYTVSLVRDTDYGQEISTAVLAGSFWGYLEYTKADQPIIEGAKNLIIDATIHIHNFPDISVKDRLKDIRTHRIYEIVGITYDDDATVCSCRAFQEASGAYAFSDAFDEGFA